MKRIFFSYLVITSILAPACIAEFQVNTHTSNDQKNAAIAMDAEGNFIVVWSSYGQDGSSNGILGQLFDPNSTPIGDEFQINTTTSGNQTESSVAMDAMGNFVVAWQGPGIDKEDVFIQRFDPNGQPIGDELQVNNYTQGKQRYPKVAMNMDGAFAVVWESEKLIADKNRRVASCQLFDVNGLFAGEEFDVISLADCRYPDVAMDPNGNFTIVWMEDKSSNTIMAQLYNADGTAKAKPFKVSTIKFSSLTRPSIAMDNNGYFVVTWDGNPDKAKLDDIHAQLFEPNGAPIGEQFMVNTTLDGPQQYPQVAMNNEGQFIIVWNSQTGTQSKERDIFGQLYDSLGNLLGIEFQINTYMKGDQRYSDIALSDNGIFVAVWQSDGQDGSGYGIFGEIQSIVALADLNPDDLMNLDSF
ncbi:MAG: hypothetical protein ACE5NM_06650 [Sedimentisphaerales bacterium]